MRRPVKTLLATSILVAVGVALLLQQAPATAFTFNQNRIIDDPVFDDTTSMNAAQIDTFLNQFPQSCISSNNHFLSRDPTGYSPSGGFTYGGNVSAGQVIYDAAKAYDLNPQVLLTTLQKEESLVDGSAGCSVLSYTSAVGYGCPDSTGSYNYGGLNLYTLNGTTVTAVNGTCVNTSSKAGFTQQLIRAAWLFKFGEQRSEGNINWAIVRGNWDNSDDPQRCYSGPMTQGTWQRCPSGGLASYDGYTTIDGVAVHMDSGATAALYWYTPHLHGNQNFYSIFTNWFGSTSFSGTSITMNNVSQPDATPALGETVTYQVSFTNNLSDSITLDAVGIVGRLGSVTTGASRDMGWQGPVTIGAGQTSSTFTFTATIQDLGTLYVWPAINYHGIYAHYNNWGAALTSHVPNLSVSSPLSSSNPSPIASQTATLSATITNNESHAIQLDTLGIPVRYYGVYNYDTGWSTSPITIAAGATQPVSGDVLYDKPGPYSAWVSARIGGRYLTVTPALNTSVAAAIPKFSLTFTETPNATPALGEDITLKFKLKNNSGVPITLDAVGVVGRYDSPTSGINHDLGWQGPVTFTDGEEKPFTSFVSNVSDLNKLYAWVAISYKGAYIQYTPWTFMMVPHVPNLTFSAPLSINGGTSPTIGQTVSVTATIKNNEPRAIRYNAIGIPVRFYGVYNYDAVWQGQNSFAPSGQSGDTVALSGSVTFDKHGPYTAWVSMNLLSGKYSSIGIPTSLTP